MIKKILILALVVFIIVGAVYSYNKVDFGQKTAMLFGTAFGGEQGMMGGPGGGPPQGDARGGGPPQGDLPANPDFRPDMGRGGETQQPQPGVRPNIPQGAGSGSGPSGEMREGGQPSARRIISLQNVIPYAFILAFFVLITRFLEMIIRGEFFTKFSDWVFPMS